MKQPRKVKWDKLSPQKRKMIDRAMMRKIHSSRHDTVKVVYDFLTFLKLTGNQAVYKLHGMRLDSPAAMEMRRKALERANKKLPEG